MLGASLDTSPCISSSLCGAGRRLAFVALHRNRAGNGLPYHADHETLVPISWDRAGCHISRRGFHVRKGLTSAAFAGAELPRLRGCSRHPGLQVLNCRLQLPLRMSVTMTALRGASPPIYIARTLASPCEAPSRTSSVSHSPTNRLQASASSREAPAITAILTMLSTGILSLSRRCRPAPESLLRRQDPDFLLQPQ